MEGSLSFSFATADRSCPKPSGWLISTDPESDKSTTQDTVMCCHCGRHWVWVSGSGRKRGWCMRCNGFTCGGDRCDSCVPFEQWLENVEGGKPEDHRPIIVSSGWEAQ